MTPEEARPRVETLLRLAHLPPATESEPVPSAESLDAEGGWTFSWSDPDWSATVWVFYSVPDAMAGESDLPPAEAGTTARTTINGPLLLRVTGRADDPGTDQRLSDALSAFAGEE